MVQPSSLEVGRVERRWSIVTERPADFQLKRIEVLSSNVFARQVIEFERLTLITGWHGTGKTMLLRLIEACLSGRYRSNAIEPPIVSRLSYAHDEVLPIEAVVEFTVVLAGRVETFCVDLAETSSHCEMDLGERLGESVNVEYLSERDAGWDRGQLMQYLPVPFNLGHHGSYGTTDLAEVRAVLGRSYRGVRLAIVQAGSDEWPLFEAVSASSGQVATSLMMSQGEHWVHWLLHWGLRSRRVKALYLLDEPESALAPRGHRAFLDAIVRRSVSRGTQIVMASHSEQFAEGMPLKNTRVCVEDRGKIRVIAPTVRAGVARAIAARGPRRAVVILVGDDFAAVVLRRLIGIADADCLRGVDVAVGGGYGDLVAAARALSRASGVAVISVVDGDARAHADGLRICALPGSGAPESELRRAASEDPEGVAAALRVSAEDVLAALTATATAEHHEWPREFAAHLNCSADLVVSALCDMWIRIPGVRNEVDEIVIGIRAAGGSRHA